MTRKKNHKIFTLNSQFIQSIWKSCVIFQWKIVKKHWIISDSYDFSSSQVYIHWVTWHFTTSKSDSKHKANIVSAIETALLMRFVANFFHVIFSYLSFIIHSSSDFSFKKRDYREFFGWCLSQSMLYRRKYWLAVVQDGWHWRQVIAIDEWHFYIVFVHFIPNSIFFFIFPIGTFSTNPPDLQNSFALCQWFCNSHFEINCFGCGSQRKCFSDTDKFWQLFSEKLKKNAIEWNTHLIWAAN